MGVNVDGYNNLEGEQLDFYWEENKKNGRLQLIFVVILIILRINK